MTDEHRSIGEVLDLLQTEFPDVTVSKIRFLESQGLIAPERTPSGYRKFYEPDVERLRWILQQQRDHYLPLKVIKERLVEIEEERAADLATATQAPPAPDPPPAVVTDGSTRPVPTGDAVIPSHEGHDNGDGGDEPPGIESGDSLGREELGRLTGLDERSLRELDGFGLLPSPRVVDGREVYDEEAVVVGRLCRGFLRHGVEPRHLRMYKTFAEREAAFMSQLVVPLLRQRNPDARSDARDRVSELARLGGGLRAAMLRVALRDALDDSAGGADLR